MTSQNKNMVFLGNSYSYLIDTEHSLIVDGEATRSIRQAEVGSTNTILKCVSGSSFST
ncbi:MAG: hypothetical protein AB8B58_01995 [Roseobacter sp.]